MKDLFKVAIGAMGLYGIYEMGRKKGMLDGAKACDKLANIIDNAVEDAKKESKAENVEGS